MSDDRQIPPWPLPHEFKVLGLKVTSSNSLGAIAGIGWAVLPMPRNACTPGQTVHFGTAGVIGDAISTALSVWRGKGRPPVQLYRFTDETFWRSRAAREGATLQQHQRMIDTLTELMQREGGAVEVITVRHSDDV